jgi:hypothetical protein
MKIPVFLLFIFLIFNSHLYSQNKVEADIGIGLFEGISLKVKYGNNAHIALCQGFAQRSFWMTGIEGYYHFADVSKHLDQRTFYVMMGLSSTLFAGGYDNFEKIVLYSRLGKTFNFSEKSGLNIDVGGGVLMADDIYGYHSSGIPTFGIHYFRRF